jgi:hypothetical protein
LIIIRILAAGAALLAATPALADQRDFRLVNRTGYVVSEVYVSPSATDNWEEDVMGTDTLAKDASVNISFNDRGKACLYDMKLVHDDGDTATWTKINLCEVSVVTVRYDKDGDPVAEFD